MTKITLALISLAIAMAGATQVQAGAGSVLLGQPTFENRCDANGGLLDAAGTSTICDLGHVEVTCAFEAAYADCKWNGPQGSRAAAKLIGYMTPDSIVHDQDGGGAVGKGKGKGGGGFQQDLPKKAP